MQREMQRSKVDNPFSMGPRTGRSQYQPDLQSRVPSRESFNKGMSNGAYIADALLKFAGIAGDAYVKKTAKQVEADKIVQTARAHQGYAPGEEATTAGYRAHASIVAENQVNKKIAYLRELSKANPTPEEWEQELQRGYEEVDAHMSANYPGYDLDEELQKVTSITFREKIPGLTYQREADRVAHEAERRIESVTDKLQYQLEIGAVTPDNIGRLLKIEEVEADVLQLTPAQKEESIVNAIVSASTDEAKKRGIAIAKEYKGKRNSSVYSRSKVLQKIEGELQRKEEDEMAYDRAQARVELEQDFYTGLKDVSDLVKAGKEDPELTASEIETMIKRRNMLIVEQARMENIVKALDDPGTMVAPGTTKGEMQEGLNYKFNRDMQIEAERQGLYSMPDAERQESEKEIRTKVVRRIANHAVAEGIVFDTILDNLNMVASLDTLTMIDKGAKFDTAPPLVQQTFDDFNSMSPEAQHQHLASMSSHDREVISSAIQLTKQSVPVMRAIQIAQEKAKIPAAHRTKDFNKGVDKVIKGLGRFLKPNIQGRQKEYIYTLSREQLALGDPTDKDNIDRVVAAIEANTTISGKTRYNGTPKELTKITGLHQDKLDSAFDNVKKVPALSQRISDASELYGFKPDDCFAVTDPASGTFYFMSPNGIWRSPVYDLGNIRSMQAEAKVQAEKLLDTIDTIGKDRIDATNYWGS